MAFGETGSGKTHLVRSLIGHTPRLLVADTTGDFARDWRGVTVRRASTAARVIQAAGAGPFRVRLELDLDQLGLRAYAGEAVRSSVVGLQAAAIALAAGNCALVLDELENYCSPDYCPPVLLALAKVGRHRRVSYLGTSVRPADVSRDVTSSASVVFAFRMAEPRDLDYLSSRFGKETRALATLPPRHCLVSGYLPALRLLSAPPLDARYCRVLPSGVAVSSGQPS